MKNTFLFISFSVLISWSGNAQTTFNYSGTSNYDYFGFQSKISVIGQNNNVNSITNQVGMLGIASNVSTNNYGIIGTTKSMGLLNTFFAVGVMGDNVSNNLNFNNGYTFGGIFKAKNAGTNSNVIGVNAQATGSNNSTITYGVEATAVNTSNTTLNKTIAVRAITNSGTSSTTTFLSAVTNPAGYFSGNDGQGIYATTTGGYNYFSDKVSQAITGYSNVSARTNTGVVGVAEGSGAYKYGIYGYVKGSGGTTISAAICGQDAVNDANSYAGYFYGDVGISSNLTVIGFSRFFGAITGTTASFSGCVTASNLSCPSDSRYKKNIKTIENPLSNILKINGVRYDWKAEEFPEKNFSDKNQIGFIAQEIEKIFPEMVFTDENGFKSVDYARLTPVLVEAIKELTLKNQKLENRLEKIEEILSVSASKK